MIFKTKEGKTIEMRAEGDAYICPGCKGACAGMACAVCKTMLPPNFCASCGYCMGTWTCPQCKQPEPTSPAVQAAAADYADEGLRSASLSMGFEIRSGTSEFEGIVTAYASSEIRDSKGTILDQPAVAELLKRAAVDVQHKFREVKDDEGKPAIKLIPEATMLVRRHVDGQGEVELTKTEIFFNLACKAAKDVFDGIRSGIYKGLSIAFDAARQKKLEALAILRAGGTPVIVPDELPFVSIIDDPSNALALIADYRSRQKAGDSSAQPPNVMPPAVPPPDELAAIVESLDSVRSAMAPRSDADAADAAAATPETRSADEPGTDLAEQLATLKADFLKFKSEVFGLMRGKLVPTLDAVRSGNELAIQRFELRWKRELDKIVKQLTGVTRVSEPDEDAANLIQMPDVTDRQPYRRRYSRS